jgi:outer membrane protein assembly factor BamD (BamD/ComL family)
MKLLRFVFMATIVLAASCNSNVDRELAKIETFYPFIKPNLKIDSLPQNADSILWAFAINNPKHRQADTFAYQSIQIKVARNHTLQAAQWAEIYLEKFKKSTNHRIDLHIMGAHYYEQHEVYDKALALYKSFIKEFPDHEMKPQAKQMIEFIEKGLVTPEQQLEYLLKKQQNP